MALGWNELERMKRVEARANALGFELCDDGGQWVTEGAIKSIYVRPKDDWLPIYSRTSNFFIGTLESIDYWLDGIEWARHYDDILKVSDNKKRTKREQLVRNQHLMKTIKTGELAKGIVGSLNVDEWRLHQEEMFDEDIPF